MPILPSSQEPLALSPAAMLVARKMAGAVLDESFGMEIGRDVDAPFSDSVNAYRLGLELGLAAGRQVDRGDLKTVVTLEEVPHRRWIQRRPFQSQYP